MNRLVDWFARNSVAANLLMIFIIAWGLSALATRIPLEVFPSFELDRISITVPFRGATPLEVESGVTIRIEEAIQDISGIKRMSSTSSEGVARVMVELDNGYNTLEVLDKVEQRIDGVSTFPEDMSTPSIVVPDINSEVISVVVSGAVSERELRNLSTRVRDELEALPDVSSVSLSGARAFEIGIEVAPGTLDAHGLTLAQIAEAIDASSMDLAAGALSSAGGEVLLRTQGQAYSVEEFAAIPVLARNDGTRLELGEVASIIDGFEEDSVEQRFNGEKSVSINVYRTGLQSAIEVADTVKQYISDTSSTLPHGVNLGFWRDSSRVVKARVSTLTTSALQGGLLVMILLTLFLRFWVAAWVFIGVPVSILGGIALMPIFGVSLNLLSLFAFILVLGIVVDDAIVTGENIYAHMRRNPDRVQAAIDGAQEVAVPVTFGVLTTVAAFSPLLMIDGARGQVFAQIPLVVIPVLLFSIIESKFVLPSHMSQLDFFAKKRPNAFARLQYRIADGFERFVHETYQPFLAMALRQRYLVLAVFVGGAIIIFSLVSSGHVRFVFFPRVQSETARSTLEMPEGTPFELTRQYIDRISEAADALALKYIDTESGRSIIDSVMATAGSANGGTKGTHLGGVVFEIVPPEERTLNITSQELVDEWRRTIGEIPGASTLTFRAEIGRGGSPINVELSGFEFEQLRQVSVLVREKLAEYPGVSDISDTFDSGKEEIRLSSRPEAGQLGITLADIAAQVRTAYLGHEVQSIQRNRDEVKVYVRYPQQQRESVTALESLSILSSSGRRVPLSSVARIEAGQGLASIRRVDRRRTINVEADVDKEGTNIEGIKAELTALGDELKSRYPDVRLSLEGEAREQRESFASLRIGLIFVLLVIYTLLAIPFKSYLQPLLVMAVIPFGVVGGVLGHMIMGMSLSVMSYMGMLALCGVVVNDSLVLVDWINRQRSAGVPLFDAVRSSGVARFRAVILTSLTTFFGLIPLILESSTQAQFLIPMAVSLGYGILFATLVTLILIPVNYLVLEDLRCLARRLKT